MSPATDPVGQSSHGKELADHWLGPLNALTVSPLVIATCIVLTLFVAITWILIGQSEENPEDSSMGAIVCLNGNAAVNGSRDARSMYPNSNMNP